jgi:putative transposase
MKRLQAYKYQIKTNGNQERQLRQFAGSCRFVWNKTLAMQKERLDTKESCLSYNKIALLLPQWKVEHQFLKESHSQVLQQALMNLDRAVKDAFNKSNPKRFPIFKKRGKHDSFRFPQGFKLDQPNSRIFLPKIGWIHYRNSRIMEGTAKNITVSQSGGHWYISIQTEREVEQPVHPSTSIIGIDVGIAKFATLSDGTIFEPVNSFKKHQQRLARYQRSMSRKKKFSSNWKKAKLKINKLHTRIANVRKDYLHKTTTTISQNHAIVCIEDLKIKNMSKSANGTIEKPGRNVRAKSGLNRSILDQGWFEFRRQLEYKQVWNGGEVLAAPARNTSRKCNICGHTAADNRTSQAIFKCTACGHEANADVNAALNILAAGHAVLVNQLSDCTPKSHWLHSLIACGEIVQPDFSMNQEPAEAIQAYA